MKYCVGHWLTLHLFTDTGLWLLKQGFHLQADRHQMKNIFRCLVKELVLGRRCSPHGRIFSNHFFFTDWILTFSMEGTFLSITLLGSWNSWVAVGTYEVSCDFFVLFLEILLCSLAELNMYGFFPFSFLLDLRILISEFLKKMRLWQKWQKQR